MLNILPSRVFINTAPKGRSAPRTAMAALAGKTMRNSLSGMAIRSMHARRDEPNLEIKCSSDKSHMNYFATNQDVRSISLPNMRATASKRPH